MCSNPLDGGAAATRTSRPPATVRRNTTASRHRGARHGGDDRRTTELALAARCGEPDALEDFVRATRDDVWRFVASLAGTESADDLTQETYIRALSALVRFAGRSHARPWLLAIARRVVADHFRARAVRPTTVGADWQGEHDRRSLGEASSFDEELALLELMDRLSDDRREAFVLTQVAGFSYEEAARLTGRPVGTVRSRVFRARRDLATALHSPVDNDRPVED
jgi:RNA polymerase sigma-70 factor, ECF subfamily